MSIIDDLLLMWYGWGGTQPEDIGYGLGSMIKLLFGVNFEMFIDSDITWVCPESNYFDSRETYDNWYIGKWDAR